MTYEKNVILRSPITGEFFFARKVRLVSGGGFDVVGEKIDVTRFIAPYLREEFQTEWTHSEKKAEGRP